MFVLFVDLLAFTSLVDVSWYCCLIVDVIVTLKPFDSILGHIWVICGIVVCVEVLWVVNWDSPPSTLGRYILQLAPEPC